MKRMMLILLILTTTGCIELPIRPEPNAKFMKPSKAPDADAPISTTPVVEAPAVAPEQVSDGNAPQVLNALRDEMDRAAVRSAEPKP